MVNPNWPTMAVAINFSGSTWTDVTNLVQAVQADRGKQYELGAARSGSLSILLDNHSGNFDPSNTSSAYYPNVLLYKKIRVQATWASVTTTIWQGYIDRWPQSYLSQGNWQMTPLKAVDILGVLRQKKFLPIGEEMIQQQAPTYWWPMNSVGAQSNVIQERVAGIQNGTIATFGGNQAVSLGSNSFFTLPLGLEGNGGATFTPINPGYGYPSDMSVLRFLKPLNGQFFPFPSVPWTLTCVVQTTNIPAPDTDHGPSWLFEWTDSGGGTGNGKIEFIRIGISQKGLLYFRVRDANGSIADSEWNSQLADGLPHVLSIEFSGTAAQFYFSLDGKGVGNIPSGNMNGWQFDQLVTMNVGGSWATNAAAFAGFAGSISEIVWFGGQHLVTDGTGGNTPGFGKFAGSSADPNSLPSIILHALDGQTSDQRISSLMTLAGFGSQFTSLGTGAATLQGAVIGGQDAATAITNVGITEGGTVFVRGDGNLVFSPRTFRYAPVAAITIGDGTNYPLSSLDLSYDTQQVVTQSQVTRRSGNVSISNNAAQQAAVGLFTNQIGDSGENTDNQCLAHAQYITGFFGKPSTRAEKLSVNLGANPVAFALLNILEINTCVQVNHTPLGGAPVSYLLWVEQVRYTISPDSFLLEFEAVPADKTAWTFADTSGKNTLDNVNLKLAF